MSWPLAAATVGAGVLGFLGQNSANAANQRQLEQQHAYGREMFGKQTEFAERMANTQYQRATEDMRAAGINPMLAIMQGGAAAPGAPSPAGGSPVPHQNTLQGVAATALEAYKQSREDKMVDAQISKAKAEAKATERLAKKYHMEEIESWARGGNEQLMYQRNLRAIPHELQVLRSKSAQAHYDEEMAKFDAYVNRATRLLTPVTSALGGFGLGKALNSRREALRRKYGPAVGDDYTEPTPPKMFKPKPDMSDIKNWKPSYKGKR